MWNEEAKFEGFGPNPVDPFESRNLSRLKGVQREDLRAAVRGAVPKLPGVYGMLDRNERLIYVGKSKTLRNRLLSYFSPKLAAEKAGRIIETTRHIVWEVQPSEFSALLREQQLIRRWTPRWNVQEIPKRQRPVYLCLGRDPAVCFFLSRLPPKDFISCEGPFMGAGRMGRAVDVLNSHFRLRDCKNTQGFHFSNQLSLFELDQRPGCLRFEIGTCSGPCAGKVSLGGYSQQVNAARSFLDGFNSEPITALQDAMERSAKMLNFEHAARLRDDLRAMDYLYAKLRWLADARRRFNFIYAGKNHGADVVAAGSDVAGNQSLDSAWYLIRAGEVVEVMAAPRCPDSFAAAKPVLRRWRAEIETSVGNATGASTLGTRALGASTSEASLAADRGHGPYPHTLSLVAAWFRKFPNELDRTFHPGDAGYRYRRFSIQSTEGVA